MNVILSRQRLCFQASAGRCNTGTVRPSVCHTRDPRLNGSRYRNPFCSIR